MKIKILDGWLKEYVETKARPQSIAEKLSLTSVSIERIEEYKGDSLYDIEVTTNRPDLMSVVGLAREAAAVLPQFDISAKFNPPKLSEPKPLSTKPLITIQNDPKLVNRVCAAILEVRVKPTPQEIVDRLEASDIRSLNNLIDVTNYVMRTIGHPTHVFDFDRLNTKKLTIRESKKGEEIETLDGKKHVLPGGDIVAVDENGRIVDLLGVMGLENSIVTDQTKRILFFIDNNNPAKMRKTSMSLGIRSEAVQLNEKGLDPDLAMDALLYGIALYEKIADGKLLAPIIDIYLNKPKKKIVKVSEETLRREIGVEIPEKKILEILKSLNLSPVILASDEVARPESPTMRDPGQARMTKSIECAIPTYRNDLGIEEDIIEEIARVYGYHNLPSNIPPLTIAETKPLGSDPFYWENRIKEALKYWGFTEVYSYSMVAESMYEGPLDDAVKLRNPLDEDHVYMRNTLVPSLLQVINENKNRKTVRIFEIANIYQKNGTNLPTETRLLAGVLKKPDASFYEVKGTIEQLFWDLGIRETSFKPTSRGGVGADVHIGREDIGSIEVFDDDLIDFELNLELITKHATLKKTYNPLAKYPPVIEDLALIVSEDEQTGNIIETIKSQNDLIVEVSLLDKYETTRTFHIVYMDRSKNLSAEEVAEIRNKIIEKLRDKYKAKLKE